MILISYLKAQEQIAENLQKLRLQNGLTQEGLAKRSGVSLSSLRKFEQKGTISLISFLKLSMVLDCLENILNATKLPNKEYTSIDEVLSDKISVKEPKRGWKK